MKLKLILFFLFIRRVIKKYINFFSYLKLKKIKQYQKERYYNIVGLFWDNYQKIKNYIINDFVMPSWNKFSKEIEKVLLPYPPFNFLNNSLIMFTMFATSGGKWLRKELTYLEKKIPQNKLQKILLEDYVGEPLLLNKKYLTSHNSIHHFYSIIKFLDTTKCNLKKINYIIEWGGGYGNMAKLFLKYKKEPATYIIIDLPIFSCLQWFYLSIVLGKEKVVLLKNRKDKINKNKVNIIPLGIIKHINLRKLKNDLFISTWALSESTKNAHNYVIKNRFFNSKHLLIAYQKSKNWEFSCDLDNFMKKNNFKIQEIDFLPNNFYAFK